MVDSRSNWFETDPARPPPPVLTWALTPNNGFASLLLEELFLSSTVSRHCVPARRLHRRVVTTTTTTTIKPQQRRHSAQSHTSAPTGRADNKPQQRAREQQRNEPAADVIRTPTVVGVDDVLCKDTQALPGVLGVDDAVHEVEGGCSGVQPEVPTSEGGALGHFLVHWNATPFLDAYLKAAGVDAPETRLF